MLVQNKGIIIGLVLLPFLLFAQTLLWSNMYNTTGSGYSWGDDVCIDQLNVYVSGDANTPPSVYDMLVIKYEIAQGSQEDPWELDYGYDDWVGMMCQDDSLIYITGYYQHDPNSSFAIKIRTVVIYKSNMTQKWAESYGGDYELSKGYGIAVDQSGCIYVVGTTHGDCVVLKYDPYGNLLWQSIHHHGYHSFWNKVVITNTGELFVMGRLSQGVEDKDIGIAKYSPDDGTLLALQTWHPDPNETCIDDPCDIDYDAAGNIYVAGATYWGSENSHPVVLKYDSNLNLIWTYHYFDPSGNACHPHDLAVSRATGECYITGRRYVSYSNHNVLTIAINPQGGLLWNEEYGSAGEDEGEKLAITPSCVYVTGRYYGTPPNTKNFLLLCYWRRPWTNQLLWAVDYDFGGEDQSRAIALSRRSPRTSYIACAGERLTSPFAITTVLYRCREPIDMYVWGVAPSNIPEATGYNNSHRLIRDTQGILHLMFTSGNNIYHTSLQDRSWSEPEVVAEGMYPSLLCGSNGKLYSIYAHNEPYPTFLEELRFAVRDAGGWIITDFPVAHTCNSFLWGIGAPSFAIKDTIGYFVFESIVGPLHPRPDSGYMIMIIPRQGQALVYGKFSLSHPENFQYQILDMFSYPIPPIPVDTIKYREIVKDSLVSPSIAVDADGVVHILWEGKGDSLRYYRIQDTMITREFYPGTEIDYPFITTRGDQIEHFWWDMGGVKYRYGWTGKTALSQVRTIAVGNSPFSSGPYLTWTKQDDIYSSLYYGKIPASGMIEPVELGSMEMDLFTYPLIFYNPPRFNAPASLDIVWTEYCAQDSLCDIFYRNIPIEEPPPTYTFDMGEETPVPVCVQRDGFKVLGPEDYQSFDFDSTELIYHLPLHSPHTKYKIRWTYYHEEANKLKLQFKIDDILHHNRWVNPGEKITEETWIPDACLHDNEITIGVKKLSGTIAVLSGIEIESKEVGGGGPQGGEAGIASPFYLARIYPNPTRGMLHIKFKSSGEQRVDINLYDVSGRLVAEIFDGKSKIAVNEIHYSLKGLPGGIYFLETKARDYRHTEKVIHLP
uniref:T9SS type A sorting domain-containing protein n=1 Tax=candidate division WOR-3 bacterium TaxID=2052148 RepID=A0A7C4TC40_UNCW3